MDGGGGDRRLQLPRCWFGRCWVGDVGDLLSLSQCTDLMLMRYMTATYLAFLSVDFPY